MVQHSLILIHLFQKKRKSIKFYRPLVAKRGFISLLVAALVPDITGCITIFRIFQFGYNNQSFILDKRLHLITCLHLMGPDLEEDWLHFWAVKGCFLCFFLHLGAPWRHNYFKFHVSHALTAKVILNVVLGQAKNIFVFAITSICKSEYFRKQTPSKK